MARVQRANVILQVEDFEVQHYMNMGYSLIDERGSVLKEAIPNSIGVLQTKYLEHINKIAELEETITQLKAQLNTKKSGRKAKESE